MTAIEKALAYYKSLFQNSPDAYLIMSTTHAVVIDCNYAAEAMLCAKREHIIGMNPATLSPVYQPDGSLSIEGARKNIEYTLKHKKNRFEWLHKRLDNSEFWAEVSVTVVESSEEVLFLVCWRNISERKKNQWESAEYLRLMIQTIQDYSIIMIDPNGYIMSWNDGAEKIHGYKSKEIIGKCISTFYLEEDVIENKHLLYMDRAKDYGFVEIEGWRRRKDGTRFYAEVVIRAMYDERRSIIAYVKITRDITDKKIKEQRIEYLAHYDVLTGLPNRQLLADKFEQMIKKATCKQEKIVLLFLDLDNFKHVNDTYGHLMGDRLLREVSERIRSSLRDTDVVGRLSGDEFMVLLDHVNDEKEIVDVAKSILNSLEEAFVLNGSECYVSASIGIARYPDDGVNTVDLLKHADLAMYRSKEAGRNRYFFFNTNLYDSVKSKMELLNDLHHAFENDELEVFYQPILRVIENQCIGVEALIRWHHPQKGLLTPEYFIPLAEEQNLIHEIGEWVMRTACKQMTKWQEIGIPLKFITVNVSGKQIMQKDFTAVMKNILIETRCPPELIMIELTESFVMSESDGAPKRLEALRALGLGIAIDDFGTGYSSLSYLKRLPVTKIKLDQSFVHDIPYDTNDIAIARAIIKLGEAVNLEVVAEGIETVAQYEFLLSEGCAMGQGYLYAKPMPASICSEYLLVHS